MALIEMVQGALGVSGNKLADLMRTTPITVSRRRRGIHVMSEFQRMGYRSMLELAARGVDVVAEIEKIGPRADESIIMAHMMARRREMVEVEVARDNEQGAEHLEGMARSLIGREGYSGVAKLLLDAADKLREIGSSG